MLPGNPAGAVPLIQKAVDTFRSAGQTKSIDYVYSLYNLGWALRLAGRPADAIPYLQERLKLSSYKRGIVEQELRTAQAAAGQTPAKQHGPAKRAGTRSTTPPAPAASPATAEPPRRRPPERRAPPARGGASPAILRAACKVSERSLRLAACESMCCGRVSSRSRGR